MPWRNGHWYDPDDETKIPHITEQSLKKRADQPRNATTRALPGSGQPQRRPEPLIFPPAYTARPDSEEPITAHQAPTEPIELPVHDQLPGSGLNATSDPILTDPFSKLPKYQKINQPTRHQLPDGDRSIPIQQHPKVIQRAKDLLTPKPERLGSPGTRFPDRIQPPTVPTHDQLQPQKNPLDSLFRPTYTIPAEFNVTDVKSLAKLYTREAIDILMEIARDKDANANARVNAAENILNRGWGKPEVQVTQTIKHSVHDFSDDEILSILSSAATVVEDLNESAGVLGSESQPGSAQQEADDGNGASELGGDLSSEVPAPPDAERPDRGTEDSPDSSD